MRPILIDPGHGGHDPGATFGQFKESDMNLKVARILHDLLNVSMRIPARLTRANDTSLLLSDRVGMAGTEHANARMFISLHINSFTTPVSGFEVWAWEKSNQSVRLARNLLAELDKAMSQFPNRGLKKTNALYVLKRSKVQRSALIEFGFINDEHFTKWFFAPLSQQRLAWAVAKGIDKTMKGE